MKSFSYEKDWVKSIELELSNICNLNCPLCARNYKEAQHLLDPYARPLTEIIAQLDEYPDIEKCTLAGILSEPTLYSELFGLLKYLDSRDIATELFTNANTHDEDYWEKLGEIATKNLVVIFTICGSTQEIHERYRTSSDLQQILDHHAAYRRGSKFSNDYLQHIMFEYNKDDFKNMDYIRQQFSNECNIESLPYNYRFKNIKELLPDMSQRYELLEKYATIHKYAQTRIGKKTEMRCKSHDCNFISIDNRGKIYPCFIYRIFNTLDDWNLDFTNIMKFKYDFCYECEKNVTHLLDNTCGLERMQ